MKHDKLHDAIGMIDDEFILQTQKLRDEPKKTSAFVGIAAAVILVCVIFLGVFPAFYNSYFVPDEDVADGATMPDATTGDIKFPTPAKNDISFKARYAEAGCYEEAKAKTVCVIRTFTELEALGITDEYNELFFEKNVLYLVVTEGESGCVQYEVTSVSRSPQGDITISIAKRFPDGDMTDDIVQKLIFIECASEFAAESNEKIHLDFHKEVIYEKK